MSELRVDSILQGRPRSPFRYDVIRRRKPIVLLLTVIAVLVAAGISLTAHSVYRAETKIIVGQGGGLVQPGFANSIQPYTATMSDLIHSDIVATDVIRNLKLNVTSHALLSRISTSINPQTAVIDVYVDDTSQATAVAIDREVGAVFSRLVAQRFGVPSKGSGATATQPLTANVFDPAHILAGRVSPHPPRTIGIALVLGLALGLMGAFVVEHFDRQLRTRPDIERAFAAPIVAQIPHMSDTGALHWDGASRTADSFRSLRANLHYLGIQRQLQTLLVTSAEAGQGKTTVATNLAIAIATSGASVIAVDADLRRPQMGAIFASGRNFGVAPDAVGLTNVLVGQASLRDAIRRVSVPPDGEAVVSVLPSGPLPPNPAELMSSARMHAVVAELKAAFDYVIFDSPPVLPVADALELARLTDGVIVVVRRNHATSDEAAELRASLGLVDIHPLGVVITDAETTTASYSSYNSDGQYRKWEDRQPRATRIDSRPTRQQRPAARR